MMKPLKGEAFQSWAKFLNPHSLRSNLIVSSLFIVAYETLKNTIIGHVRSFFMVEFDSDGSFTKKYEDVVLSRHKSPLRSSLLWFQEMNVVNNSDLDLVDRIREHRNEIAHDLPSLISNVNRDVKTEMVKDIWNLVTKIDRWWIREIELPTNPDFDGENIESIPDTEITSGNMMFLSVLLEAATGDITQAEKTYDEFVTFSEKFMRHSNSKATTEN